MGLTRDQAFPSKWLKKEDVDPARRFTIATIYQDEVQGNYGAETKVIVTFTDPAVKPLILNATNWDAIGHAYSDNTDLWVGKVVELYHDPTVMNKGKRVGGIRVRIPTEAAAPASAAPASAAAASADVLTFDAAIAAVVAAGGTRETLTGALQAQGISAYRAARDTATARRVVQELGAAQDGVGGLSDDSEIPF